MFSRKPALTLREGILQLARLFKRVTSGARIPFSAMPDVASKIALNIQPGGGNNLCRVKAEMGNLRLS